ncbi:septum formation initiator family protein [bacterium]
MNQSTKKKNGILSIKMNIKKVLSKEFLKSIPIKYLILGLFLVQLIFLTTNKSFRMLMTGKKFIEKRNNEIASLQKEGKQFILESEKYKNDMKHIEKIARKDLGLVYPHEIIYKFKVTDEEKTK